MAEQEKENEQSFEERLSSLERRMERRYLWPPGYWHRLDELLGEQGEDLSARMRRLEQKYDELPKPAEGNGRSGDSSPNPDEPEDNGNGDDDDHNRDRRGRWVGYRVGQVGATNNMLIALSGATVAFVAAFGNLSFPGSDVEFEPAASWMTWVGLVFAVLSATFGVAMALVRIANFKKTVSKVNLDIEYGKEQDKQKKEEKKQASRDLKDKCNDLDDWTYGLLYAQIVTWIMSAIAIVIGNYLILQQATGQ